jgi:hypothetical protein
MKQDRVARCALYHCAVLSYLHRAIRARKTTLRLLLVMPLVVVFVAGCGTARPGSIEYSDHLTRASIAAARSGDIQQLDPSLQSMKVEEWLLSLPGALNVQWESNDCGEQSGSPDQDDFPICAEATVMIDDGRVVSVSIVAGMYRSGIRGGLHLWGAYIRSGGTEWVEAKTLGGLIRKLRAV